MTKPKPKEDYLDSRTPEERANEAKGITTCSDIYKEDWEKRWEKVRCKDPKCLTCKDIKQFIKDLLKEQREEMVKEWLNILKTKEAHYKLREKLVIKQVKEDYREHIVNEKIGYNQALQDLTSKLKNIKE